MTYETLRCEPRDGIAFVTFNRPDKLNALSRRVMTELAAVVATLETDHTLRAALFTGAGKAFVAGADISEFDGQDPVAAAQYARAGQRLFNRLEQLGKPSLAAVNGFALGGGCEFALSCTLRTASTKAKFGQPEVKLGIIPGYGGTQRLARLVGLGRAQELVLTGEMIDAAEAHRIGLVNRVFEPDALLADSEKLLRTILANGPVAVRLAQEAVFHGLQTTLAAGLELEAAGFGLCMATDDAREGTRAFLEKRPPRFQGR